MNLRSRFAIVLVGGGLWFAADSRAASAAFSIDAWIRDIAGQRYSSLERSLEALPESVRSSFTLAYRGHGLRGTSPERPGVILFSDVGDYAITFGDPEMHLGSQIEIARFDRKAARLELVTADFPPPGVDAKVLVQRNPMNCVRCHRQDPMFLWSGHPFWSGMYGSLRDRILPRGTEYVPFREFVRSYRSRENYRTLAPAAPARDRGCGSTMSPYADCEGERRVGMLPNFRMTQVAARLGGARLARKIRESEAHPRARFAMLYRLLGCADRPEIPEIRALMKDFGLIYADFMADLVTKPRESDPFPQFDDGDAVGKDAGLGVNALAKHAASELLAIAARDARSALLERKRAEHRARPAELHPELYALPESAAFFDRLDEAFGSKLRNGAGKDPALCGEVARLHARPPGSLRIAARRPRGVRPVRPDSRRPSPCRTLRECSARH